MTSYDIEASVACMMPNEKEIDKQKMVRLPSRSADCVLMGKEVLRPQLETKNQFTQPTSEKQVCCSYAQFLHLTLAFLVTNYLEELLKYKTK